MKLDIFVPFWGDPQLLFETVQSVLAQANPNWNLTVVDDCYPDSSVGSYFDGLEDPRVTYIRNEQNQGITENYRTCVKLATEELVVLLGCDDVLHPNYVDVVFDAHARVPRAGIIQPGVQVIDEHGRIIKPLVDTVKRYVSAPRVSAVTELSGEKLAAGLLSGNWLYWPSLVFHREALLAVDFRDGLPIVQDLALVVDLTLAGTSLVYAPTLCFSYRRHSRSASAATLLDGSRFEGDREYAAIAAELMRVRGWRKAERAARTRWTSRAHALSLLPKAVRSSEPDAVKLVLRHALR
jgi:glycosyltransferase involved in cell wall biosynthesis